MHLEILPLIARVDAVKRAPLGRRHTLAVEDGAGLAIASTASFNAVQLAKP